MPGLHISLGVFYRLFALLEAACHQLDIKLAATSKQEDTLPSFRLYSTALHNIDKLKEKNRDTEEAVAAEQLSTFLAVRGMGQQQVEFCRQAAAELHRKIATLVSAQSSHTICRINSCILSGESNTRRAGHHSQGVYS